MSINASAEKQERQISDAPPVLDLGEHANLFRNVAKRSPILGYNHNISHRGLVFHVQTEDSGVDNPHLFTHLFHGGVIVSTRRLDYDAGSDDAVVKALMRAQHKAVLKELRRGGFDGRIDAYLGNHPDLQPSLVATIPDAPRGAEEEPTDPELDKRFANATPEALASPATAPLDTLDEKLAAADAVAPNASMEEAVDMIALPSDITSSDVSNVFRIITTPAEEEAPARAQRATPSPRPAATQPPNRLVATRQANQDTVEIHSPPPAQDVPESEFPESEFPESEFPESEFSESKFPENKFPESKFPESESRQSESPESKSRESESRGRYQHPRPHHSVLRNLPPPPGYRGGAAAEGHARQRGQTGANRADNNHNNNVLISNHIMVDGGRGTAAPSSRRPVRNMPRTVRDDHDDSQIFEQSSISEKSLDEVILAYLSEDAGKDDS